MGQTGPWSVKGIDQRARDAAREAASAEGLTLGEYLNKLLIASDGPQPNEVAAPFNNEPPRGDAASSTLDLLTRRVEATEARSTLAITGMDHTVLGLVARLENAENGSSAIAGHVEGFLDELRETHEALQSKVEKLESDDSAEQNLEALKSLENALGKLASHVYEESEMAQNETLAIKGRVESGFTDLTDRVEGMETKVESKLSDAASRVERLVEQAELRVEGTTRHLSDRMSSLEANVTERLTGIKDNDARMDAVESDVSGALDSMENTLLRIQDRLNRAEGTTDTALKSLETTFDHLDKRIEEVAKTVDPELAEKLRTEFELRFDDMTKSVRDMVDTTRLELADEITRTASSASADEIAELKETLSIVNERIAQAEVAQSENIALNATELQRVSDDIATRIEEIEEREGGVPSEEIRGEIVKLEETVVTQIDSLSSQVEAVDQRVNESEKRNAEAIEKVGENVSGQIDALSAEVTQRVGESETRNAEAFEALGETIGEQIETLDANVDEKIADSELRSASAIEQVGDQVASAASRLQKRQDEAIKKVASLMDDDRKKADARLSDALSNVSDRLELMQTQTSSSLSPVQKAIASLATRLEGLEEFAAPPFVKAAPGIDIPAVPTIPSNPPLFDAVEANEGFSFLTSDAEATDFPDLSQPDEVQIDVPTDSAFAEPVSAALESHDAERIVDEADYNPTDFHELGSNDSTDEWMSDFGIPAPAPISEKDETDIQVSNLGSDTTDWHVSDELKNESYENPYEDDFQAIDTGDDPVNIAPVVTGHGAVEEDDSGALLNLLDELDGLEDSQSETRESDIFDEDPMEPIQTVHSPEIEAVISEESIVEETSPNRADDLIARARKAAISAASVKDESVQKSSKWKRSEKAKKPAKAAKEKSTAGASKIPLYLAASAVVATGVSVGGYLHLRGKQPLPNTFASSTTYVDPGLAVAGSGSAETVVADTESADDLLFETPDTAAIENDLFAEQAVIQADSEGLETELFAETSDAETVTAQANSQTISTVMSATPVIKTNFAPIPAVSTVDLAAASGNRIAQYQLAQDYISAGDFQEGASLMRKAAQKDLPAAQYGLSKLHEKGTGVVKDLTLAREWTEKAAQNGNVKAMHDLAVFMAEGDGGLQSYAGAVEWFHKAADFGILDSQYNLGVLYEQGLGISANMSEALFWYEIAGRNGDASAPEKVAELKGMVSPDEAKLVATRVANWTPKREASLANGRFGAQPWNNGNPLQVKGVQTALDSLGYAVGTPDGVLGSGTEAAIKQYQLDKALTPSGDITVELVESLNTQATKPGRI